MRYRITHKTVFRYSEPASLSQNEVFLTPRETAFQRVIDSRTVISPEPRYRHRRVDYFGNTADVFMVQQPHGALSVAASSTVETRPPVVPSPEATLPWKLAAQRLAARREPPELTASQFVFESPLIRFDSRLVDYARPSFEPDTPMLAGAVDLMRRIHADFTYDKTATTVDTPVEVVLENRRGVCQDFAHLAIGCFRSLGLAARYVSGYLETRPPPGKARLVGADASHAWLSVFVPDAGWVDLDPTNNLIPGQRHVTVAWGRDYGDVTPVKGIVMGGGVHTNSVTVDVDAQA